MSVEILVGMMCVVSLMKNTTIIGLDLGQANDFTAIVILEVHGDELHVPHLERMRHKPYPEVVQHVLALTKAFRTQGRTDLVVDATGVGRGIVDMLQAVNPVRVSITSGQQVNQDGSQWNVPKKDLIAALVVAFENHKIKIANGLELGPILASEAMNLKAKISTNGHTEFKADWRDGEHDDLALALACAVWWAVRPDGRPSFSGFEKFEGPKRRW